MILLRSVNGNTIALPTEQNLWVHRAMYNRHRSFLAESWQLGLDNGYFDRPTSLSDGDIITYDQRSGRIRIVHT